MRNINLLLIMLLASFAASAQFTTVTLISPTGDGGFESGTTLAANGWTYGGHASVNAWYCGTFTSSAGSRGCYVGQSISDNNGGNSVGVTNHFYRNITIPSGASNVQLSFKLRYTTAEPNWDRFCVSVYPSTYTPVTGYYSTAYPYGGNPPGILQKLYENSNVISSYITVGPLSLNAYVGQTVRLCFTFTNADQYGTAGNPAVDEINLTYDVPCTPPAALTGSLSLCQGAPSTLSSATTGGTWSVSDPAVATIAPSGASCSVTGVAGGTATISYSVAGCPRTAVVTVNAVPAATVTATPGIFCTGNSTTLNATAALPPIVLQENFNSGLGGWTINNLSGTTTSYFQIRNSPGYNGYTPGDGSPMMEAAPDAYTSTTNTNFVSPVFSLVGYTSATLSLNQYFVSYSGDQLVAIEYSINGGSTWSTLVSIMGSGVGTTTWSASTPTSTYTLPAAMIGQSNCRLRWNYRSVWGFYWAVDNIKVNGVSAPLGVVWSPTTNLYTNAALTVPYTGALTTANVYAAPTAAAATTYNTYAANVTIGSCTNPSGTATLTVNPLPAAITGTATVCETRTTVLSSATSGGVWSSSNSAVASIAASGSSCTVTGVSGGTATISYMNPSTNCYATQVVTVYAAPLPITGTAQVCETANTTLTHPDGGSGTWSSVNPAVASVGLTSGIVSGLTSGYSTISYTNVNGCVVTREATVNPLPSVSVAPSTGVTACLGDASTFTATSPAPEINLLSQNFNGAMTGWDITNGTGTAASYWQVVTPPGTADFAGDGSSYLQAASILYTADFTVTTLTSPSFSTMGAFSTVTLNFNQYLFSFTPDIAASIEYSTDGGTVWTPIVNQALTTVADNGADGNWDAADPEYSVALPAGAVGQSNVKLRWVYNAKSLYWLIDNISVKGVMPASTFAWSGASGLSCTTCPAPVITPTATGTNAYNVAVTTSAGCVTNVPVTVTTNALPPAISGDVTICENVTGLVTSAPGGTWMIDDITKATVASGTGAITGVAAGTANLTYTSSATGCHAYAVVTVLAAPAVVTPATVDVCMGNNVTVSCVTPSGTWSSGNTSIATVTSGGVVSTVSPGTANITYTIPTGCVSVREVTVNALPPAISGAVVVCQGAVTTLTNTDFTGTWSSADPSIASVSATGVVSGVTPGNTFITYTLPTGCFVVKPMQVNAGPLPSTGPSETCVNTTVVLGNPSGSGTWSSSAPGIASVNASGIVTAGSFAGTATIYYTYSSTGCSTGHSFTVNPLPAAITGTQKVCKDATVTFASATGFGTWTSDDPAVASVDATSGVVTGINVGNTRITFTAPFTGCSVSRTITVNPLPAAISGNSAVCEGGTLSLVDFTPGGTWSSSNLSVASVSMFGQVTPVAASGMATISYILTATQCFATKDVVVNPLPAPLTGTTTLCHGSGSTLSSLSAGGTWTSSSNSVFMIDAMSGAGLATGVGSTSVSYTLPTGCRRITPVVVNPLPGDIYGNDAVCVGSQITLGSVTASGSWTSSAPGIATISPFGVVTGVAPGITTISYTMPTGCYKTMMVSVNPLPAPISGTFVICAGGTTTLTDADAGGSWSSSNSFIANINIFGGLNATNAGSTLITYTLPTGCMRTQGVLVNPLPNTITGTAAVCEGLTTTLGNATAGGTWSSDATGTATVDMTSGTVTGVAEGTANVIYTLTSTGCSRSRSVTVNRTPDAITGSLAACQGGTSQLASNPANGIWSSGATAIANVSATGLVTAAAAGGATISYVLPTGCKTTAAFVVNPLPAAITGTRVMCEAAGTTLSNATGGGMWSSANPAVASVDATTGAVTGNGQGVTEITYAITATGCSRSVNVTVNPLPAGITGTTTVCEGVTSALASATPGGVWASGSTAIASVTASGVVTGNAAGNATISYTLPTGCRTTTSFHVDALPADIAGATSVCLGQQASVTNATINGTWSSSDPSVASIDASGMITGQAVGSVTITYTLLTGCYKTRSFVVNPLPANITGTFSVCHGSATTLSNATPGGTWSSSNPSVVSISATGVVTGLQVGFSIIQYTLPTGCSSNGSMVVNPLPDPITGLSVMCAGESITLESNTTGGTWSAATGVVSVSNAGVVSGLAAGTGAVTYTTGNGCRRVRLVTVNALPGLITGTNTVCPGLTTTLSNITPGGTWTTDNATMAAIDGATGVVTANGADGTANITYTLPTGCARSRAVTVHPAVDPVTGDNALCVGGSTTLSNTTAGGVWVSSGTGIATVNSVTGVVNGISAGTVSVAYVMPTGCKASHAVVVNPLPGSISGAVAVCEGSTVLVSSTTPGGSWSGSDDAVATVSTTGMVTGVTAGTMTVSYTLPSGCLTTRSMMVNSVPVVRNVTGGGSYCAGGAGVAVGVDGSDNGVAYRLMNGGTTAVATVTGTGALVDFGNQTGAGTYTVIAVSPEGCRSDMTGSAEVVVTPLVTPAVTMTTDNGTTVCQGTSVTFTANGVNGGTTPAYSWSVNGTDVAVTGTYSYMPADGDVVAVRYTSSEACPSPASVNASVTMVVRANLTPVVTLTVGPDDTLCAGNTATFNAAVVNGGTLPVYTWLVDGSVVSGVTGPVYAYQPADNDVVTVRVNSNYTCLAENNVLSNGVTMHIAPVFVPAVEIIAVPGTTVAKGTAVTFTANVSNAGTSPSYQWLINQKVMTGAINSTFVTSNLKDGDSVTCMVTGTGECSEVSINSVVMKITPATGVTTTVLGEGDIRLMPNPNNGVFTLKGELGSSVSQAVAVEITDMLGQVVYRGNANAANGIIDTRIELGSNLANGMYMLNMSAGNERKVLHFVVKQ